MATSTPPYGALTSPNASKKPGAYNVSTPSYFSQSSPAPRSIPSPAATRTQHAGKTPVNHPTTSSSQGSKTIAGTPMVQNLSQQGMSSISPGANALNFSTPAGLGLGVDMGTPSQLNMNTPALLAAGMVPSMSELGLSGLGLSLTNSATGKRNEDEERRTRMRRILKSIGRPRGRVSEEGIARVSRRVGFANDIDVEKLTAEEKERRVGNRTISIAGNTLVIDVALKNHAPTDVQVMLASAFPAVEAQAQRAASVLLADLKQEDALPLDSKLNRFAANLERLARIDRLSSEKINCFDALGGLYTSLKRLWEQEREQLIGKQGRTARERAKEIDAEVTCNRSGRPVMHEDGRLGLAIEYWRDGQYTQNNESSDTTMDVDGATIEPKKTDDSTSYVLRIETERSSAALYPAMRVSDAWLPDPLNLSGSDTTDAIPWQVPPATFLNSESTQASSLSVDDPQTLPDLRFMAKLDPPIVLPWQVAINVLTSIGAPTPQPFTTPPLYHMLVLERPGVDSGANLTTPISAEQEILTLRDGQEEEVKHLYRLTVAKPDFGYQLEELPFSHPRQLVELLPILRPWARIGALLKQTFTSDTVETTGPSSGPSSSTSHISLDRLMSDEQTSVHSNAIVVDLEFVTAPVPTLAMLFPSITTDGDMHAAAVQFLPNGELGVAGGEQDGEGKTADLACRLVKALQATGDLGVAIEFVR